MDVRFRLLRRTLFDRDAKCQRVRRTAGADVPLRRTDRGAWIPAGLVTCGHMTCPNCGPFRAHLTFGALGAAIQRWTDPKAFEGRHWTEDTRDVWMLTLTVPHYADDPVEMIVDGLYRAWRHFTRSRAWERFEAEFGVQAVVRVLDATHLGANGCHPHFHVAIFVDKAPPGFRRERAQRGRGDAYATDVLSGFLGDEYDPGDDVVRGVGLRAAWEAAVGRTIGIRPRALEAFRSVAVELAGGEEAAGYFTKWGLGTEVAGSAIKTDSHLTLLDRAGQGDEEAGRRFVIFRAAVDGRQWVSGLGDMRKTIGVSDDDVTAYLAAWRAQRDEAEPPTLVAPLALKVRSHLWTRATHLGLGTIVAELDRADREGVADLQAHLDDMLWRVIEANPAPTWRERSASMRRDPGS